MLLKLTLLVLGSFKHRFTQKYQPGFQTIIEVRYYGLNVYVPLKSIC